MTNQLVNFFRNVVTGSVVAFSALVAVLILGAYLHIIDFYSQLDPMLMISLIISLLIGMIYAIRSIRYDHDLTPPSGSVLIPARVFASNRSRRPTNGSRE